MKTKVTKTIILLLALALVGYLGYGVGLYRAETNWLGKWTTDTEAQWHRNGRHQAFICLGALTNLHAGKESEAEAILENYLSEGIARHVSSTWTNPPRGQFDSLDVRFIRQVRDYRFQHPWTNDEREIAEHLQKAFKLAE